MRYKRTIPRHVEEAVVSTRTTCDRCGRDVAEVRREPHRADEVTIEARIGSIYEGCDDRSVYVADVCGECFEEVVLPALRDARVAVRMVDACADDRAWEPTC